jgi:hypothetical protein
MMFQQEFVIHGNWDLSPLIKIKSVVNLIIFMLPISGIEI